MERSVYIAVDLKSFYASVECVERGLDPLTTNLVVADESRTEKTICLAVSPSLKSFGVPGRPRLFEVIQRVAEVNAERLRRSHLREFKGRTSNYLELRNDDGLAVDYIIARPQMALYMKYSTDIFNIYLRYVAPEDMHVYSVDEVFIDAAPYLGTYGMTARELAERMLRDVIDETGITATVGIGTNLYLSKIAMDIVAKKMPADSRGMRIAELDEMSYREKLWSHRPITDFWRVGGGYAKKLEANGLFTMGDIARCSLGEASSFYNEELLYKLFGVNAELLIDHAWGWEPCTIADIKAYRPSAKSMSSGQVLSEPYDFGKAKIVIREMTDALVLDLIEKGYVTNQIVLTVGYDVENLLSLALREKFNADGAGNRETVNDRYGRSVPKSAHGSQNLEFYTSSTKEIISAAMELFDRIVDKELLIRRMYIVAAQLVRENEIPPEDSQVQLDLFSNCESQQRRPADREQRIEREKRMQQAVLSIRGRFGKNAVLKGTSFLEGATARERNGQIGGHKA